MAAQLEMKLVEANASNLAGSFQKEVQARKALYQDRDKVMHELRRRRLLRHKPYVPKAYQARLGGENAVKLPIMYRMVQTAVAAVMKNAPSIYTEPINAADRKASEDYSKAISLLLQSVDAMSKKPWLYGLAFNHFGDGLSVTKTLTTPWGGYPIKGDDEEAGVYNKRVREFQNSYPLPFYSKIVDPLTFYPPLAEFGDEVVMESAFRSSSQVMRALSLKTTAKGEIYQPDPTKEIPSGKPYPLEEPPPGMPPTCRVDEIWTKDECAIVIAGSNKVLLFKNPMGELPYEWGFADPTGVEDPTNIGMSVAFPLFYITPWIDSLVNIMMAWSIFAAPTPYTTRDPVPGVRPTAETAINQFQPGKMYQFATGEKPGIFTPPPVGQEVLGALGFLIESADKGGLPALVSGNGVGTRMPALTYQAAMESATDRLKPAVASFEKVLGATLCKWGRMIEKFGQPIKVNGWEYDTSGEPRTRRWATIRPSEAGKGRRIQVTLAVDSTQDLIAKGTHAQFMVNAKLWDKAFGMRFGGVKNPEETKRLIAADTIEDAAMVPIAQAIVNADPDVAAFIAQQAAEQGQVPAGAGGEAAGAEAPPPGAPTPQGAPLPAPAVPTETGPGRNRQGVQANRGGGRRGTPTQKPRGNRQGYIGKTFGRS